MTFKLPPLPYAYAALAPYMSAETLQFYHDKHHQAYVDQANNLAGDGSKYAGKSIEDICKEAFAAKDQPVINNVGQNFNHIHFWQWMGMACNQGRQAHRHEDAQRRKSADARSQPNSRL